MKKFLWLVLLVALLALSAGAAFAQSGLDYTGTPNFGSRSLRAGFSPDPYTVEITSGGFDVDNFDGSHTVVSPDIYDSPWCGGTLDSKWWPEQDDR